MKKCKMVLYEGAKTLLAERGTYHESDKADWRSRDQSCWLSWPDVLRGEGVEQNFDKPAPV